MARLFGYSHLTGGYSGGQAEYVRVPFSDVGPLVIPDDSIEDEKVLFLTDILPTGWMAAENCDIEPGDTVAVWGCGPVGLFAVQSAFLMGAERVIAIDHFPHRLELAKKFGAETINFEESKVYEALQDMTGGIGPDASIDCVGLEAHGAFADNIIDQIKVSTFLGTDRGACHPPGDHGDPQGRAGLDARRLWRVRRQVPDRRADGEGADAEDRADPRAEVHCARSTPRSPKARSIPPS